VHGTLARCFTFNEIATKFPVIAKFIARLQAAPGMTSEERITFVLAGGGSLGAVQAGMLAELLANGVRPDLIVGVSAGALNGAFLAHDPSSTMVERMAALWASVRTRDVLGFSFGTLLGLIGLRDYLAGSEGVRRLLERELPYRTIESTKVPFHVVATEQHSGDEVVLSAGDVVQAVLASTAIPGVYAPVPIGGRLLVDGVVGSGTPIATAVRLGATRIIVVPCGFTCVQRAVPRHPIGRAMHAFALLGARQLKSDFAIYADRATLRLVPPLCPLAQSPYDYSQGAALIAAARQSTRRWLDAGGLDRDEFPPELVVHSH
jgi:NTE family protein